jgi:predicted dehydrogenase
VRIFVVGLGSAGKRHLANARALGHEAEGGRLDGAEDFAPDALVVASPTSAHLEGLKWAVDHGVHAFVEKPLASSSAGVAESLAAAERAGLTVAVGYNLRFHPALEAVAAAVHGGRIGRLLSVRAEVGQYLPDWHPGEDYRASYAARADLGGGALLTLSHELDYVRWIAGEVEDARGSAAHVSSLEVDADDVAELVCRHVGGAISSVHMDLLDRSYNRRSRWVGEDGTIAWEWELPVRLLPAGETLSEPADDAISRSYVEALSDFVRAAETGMPPRCTGRDGLRTLELCDSVLAARKQS